MSAVRGADCYYLGWLTLSNLVVTTRKSPIPSRRTNRLWYTFGCARARLCRLGHLRPRQPECQHLETSAAEAGGQDDLAGRCASRLAAPAISAAAAVRRQYSACRAEDHAGPGARGPDQRRPDIRAHGEARLPGESTRSSMRPFATRPAFQVAGQYSSRGGAGNPASESHLTQDQYEDEKRSDLRRLQLLDGIVTSDFVTRRRPPARRGCATRSARSSTPRFRPTATRATRRSTTAAIEPTTRPIRPTTA